MMGVFMKVKRLLSFIVTLSLVFPCTAFAEEEHVVDESNHIYTYEEMVADIQRLNEKYPDRVEVSTIGNSVDKRPLYQVILGNKDAKNAIFIMSTIHAREWMNTWVLMDSLEICLDNWNNQAPNGETYAGVFNDCCIYLVPMVNPDGVTISQRGIDAINTDIIRENCKQMPGAKNPSKWKANADGVDLNRQWSTGWNTDVVVTRTGSEFYNGLAPFTEPEVLAVKQALTQRTFTAAITYHSMEGAIYWDVGQTGQVLDKTLALATHCKNITGYKLGEKSPCKGLEYNYMNHELGIPTVCIETGTVACPLPYSQWNKVWQENHMMMVALAGCYQD